MKTTSYNSVGKVYQYCSKGEVEVLALMGSLKVSIRDIKDAVQLLQSTDMNVIEKHLQCMQPIN